MGEKISSAEYELRMRFRQPWGHRTPSILIAQLLALTFNINRDPDKSRHLSADDFLPTQKPVDSVESASTALDLQSFMTEITTK